MKYRDMIEEAKSKGLTSETVMWESMGDVEELLCRMKQEHPKEYWVFMRKQHGRLYHNHYGKDFAEHDVGMMEWTDSDGHKHKGGHWTCEQVLEATKSMKFPTGTTDGDRYVAFNATYADLCSVLSDEQILKVAHKFWFCDEDAPHGKIWIYMCAMHEYKE